MIREMIDARVLQIVPMFFASYQVWTISGNERREWCALVIYQHQQHSSMIRIS
jgi:hypothetical protein